MKPEATLEYESASSPELAERNAQLISEAVPISDPIPLNAVLAHGLRTEQLVLDGGSISLSPHASPHFIGDLASAVGQPLAQPPFKAPDGGWTRSDVFIQRMDRGFADYLRELRVAEAAIAAKESSSGAYFGAPITGVDFMGEDLDIAFRRYQFGAIYIDPRTGAHEVHGAIYQKYLSLGAEMGFLGLPHTDELATTLGDGQLNHFAHGSIYWSPELGAWSIHGVIRDKWWQMEGERGYLGFPVSDVEAEPGAAGAQVTHFQNGELRLAPDGMLQDYPHSVMLKTHNEGGSVKCDAELWMNAKGDWRYFGHFHNDGFAGCVANVATSPRFADAGGHTFVVSAERSLGGTVDAEDRNDDWNQAGNDAFIKDNWNFIELAGIRTVLKTDTTLGDVLAVLIPVQGLLVIFAGSTAQKSCGPYGSTRRDAYGNDVPHTGFQVVGPDQQCPQPY